MNDPVQEIRTVASTCAIDVLETDGRLVLRPLGSKEEVLLEVSFDGQYFVIQEHRTHELTVAHRGQRVSAEWLLGFISENSQSDGEISNDIVCPYCDHKNTLNWSYISEDSICERCKCNLEVRVIRRLRDGRAKWRQPPKAGWPRSKRKASRYPAFPGGEAERKRFSPPSGGFGMGREVSFPGYSISATRASPKVNSVEVESGSRTVTLVNWEILPPGWWRESTRRKEVASRFGSQMESQDFFDRLDYVDQFGPSEMAMSRFDERGYRYYIFVFRRHAIAECPQYGNAAYVLRGVDDWDDVFNRSRQELRANFKDRVTRIRHTKTWKERLRKYLN